MKNCFSEARISLNKLSLSNFGNNTNTLLDIAILKLIFIKTAHCLSDIGLFCAVLF